jgi:hypothetical protein
VYVTKAVSRILRVVILLGYSYLVSLCERNDAFECMAPSNIVYLKHRSTITPPYKKEHLYSHKTL